MAKRNHLFLTARIARRNHMLTPLIDMVLLEVITHLNLKGWILILVALTPTTMIITLASRFIPPRPYIRSRMTIPICTYWTTLGTR